MVFGHERTWPGFRPRITAAEHKRVLETGMDVPDGRPPAPIALTSVGLAQKVVWVDLPEGRIPFEAGIDVNLPPDVKGIHMSRIEESVFALHGRPFSDLKAYATELAGMVLARQRGDRVRVSLRGKVPLLRKTPVSARHSVEAVEISLDLETGMPGDPEQRRMLLGLEMCHITACPCTQEYHNTLAGTDSASLPMPTHSQRTITGLVVEDGLGRVAYSDLMDCLERALHVTQGLLKRPDEAELVLCSHCSPQFVEDVVRDVALAVVDVMRGKMRMRDRVIVDTLSLESIHTHNVRCGLDTTLGALADGGQTLD